MQENNLVDATAQVGNKVQKALQSLAQGAGKGKMSALRGQGTFIAFDMESAQQRDQFVGKMRSLGVNMGGCGEKAVRLRPMLVFGESHADILLERAETVLNEL